MIKIDCKNYANKILNMVSELPDKGDLLLVTTGHDPASASFLRGQVRDGAACGVPIHQVSVESQGALEQAILEGNSLPHIHGILLQLPLPEGFDEAHSTSLISPAKDVDGFLPDSSFLPCTAEGILWILKQELGELAGKKALVIGRGRLVGLPVTRLLQASHCEVTIAHSQTQDLDQMLGDFDIIVSGAGVPGLVDLQKCRAEIVIDAGSSVVDGKLCGDCIHFDQDLAPQMRVATLPNGIGLITRAVLMAHVAGLDLNRWS